MTDLLRIILPLYFIIYFGIAFVAKSLIVAKRIGKNPLVLPKDDSAYGLIGRYFKFTLILMFIYIGLFAYYSNAYEVFSPLKFLENTFLVYFGMFLLVFALIWTIIAQNDMRNSWRIGIDTTSETELIKDGLFKYSRNPIFLGMILSLLGLFICTPNFATLFFLIFGFVLIQIQVRLEEEFLEKQHKDTYLKYKLTTRRFL